MMLKLEQLLTLLLRDILPLDHLKQTKKTNPVSWPGAWYSNADISDHFCLRHMKSSYDLRL